MEHKSMATAWQAQLTEHFEQAKTVSRSRWGTIRHRLQETLPPIWAEITAGAKEIGGIGAAVASVTTENLRTETQVTTANLRQQLGQTSQKLLAQFQATAAVQVENLKVKAADWDVKLEARYGQNYKIARQAIGKIVELYQANQTQTQVATQSSGIPTIEVPFQVVEETAGSHRD
jgi:LAS superfamily LD-carboxypeptidase LdcB